VEAATATPRLTPPSTDIGTGTPGAAGDLALRITLLVLAGIIVGLPALATARRRTRR
jgi:hypothetical protein